MAEEREPTTRGESTMEHVSDFARMFRQISTPQGVRDHGGEVARSGDMALLHILATSPYTPASVLRIIAFSSTVAARNLVREHLRLPPDVVAHFAAESLELKRLEKVGRAHRRFDRLRRPERGRIHAPRVLEILNETREPDVLSYIACDPQTPDSILAQLATAKEWWVRREVALNRSTDPSLLAELAFDTNDSVRLAVAGARSTGAKTLRTLLKDGTRRVRLAASNTLSARARQPLFDVQSTDERITDKTTSASVHSEGPSSEASGAADTERHTDYALPPSFVIEAYDAGEPRTTTFSDTRRATDTVAIRTVVLFVRTLGHHPMVMPHNNEGFDVSSKAPNGATLLIEIKGASPTARSVQMTRSQLDLAAVQRDHYVLAVVLHDGQTPRELLWWPNPYPDPPPAVVAAVELDLTEVRRQATSINVHVPASAKKAQTPLFDIGDGITTTSS